MAEETPSNFPRTELRALKTVGGSHWLEPGQPRSVWIRWEGVRGAALGSKVTMNISRKRVQQCVLWVTATTPQKTSLPSFHPNNTHICVPKPLLPSDDLGLISSPSTQFIITKWTVTCSTPTQGGDEMLFLSIPKIYVTVESASYVFSVPLSGFSKLAKHSKTSHRNNKMQSCQIKLANQSQWLSGLKIGFGFVFFFFFRLFGWAFPFCSRSWFGLHHATSLEVLSKACPLNWTEWDFSPQHLFIFNISN